jgi:hypothetical protein
VKRGLLLLALSAVGCGRPDAARTSLEAEGYRDVQLLRVEGGYQVTATQNQKPCSGRVLVTGFAGSYDVRLSIKCGATPDGK